MIVTTPAMASNLTQLRGWRIALCVALFVSGFWLQPYARAADVVMTEPQVKALCLLNFAKYVNWPSHVFATSNAPIRIGVIGDANVHAELKRAVQGKLVGGRPVNVVELENLQGPEPLHMLFLAASEKTRVPDLLAQLGAAPTLTVGEHEGFTDAGGIMVFVKRENKVRFDVNLAPARLAGIQISSRLLALADNVRGKE